MTICRYIFRIFIILLIFILIFAFLLYLFLAKETAYYYCDEICITIIQHHQGRDTFFRVYDGIIISRNAYLIVPYAEYPLETYIYIKRKKNNGKIIVENFTEPVKYKGVLNNVDFHVSSYDSNEIKYRDLRCLYLFFW